MSIMKVLGYLSCAAGAGCVYAAWVNILGGFWFAAGIALIVLGVFLVRWDKQRREGLDALDAIDIGVDLLD